jgi:NADPH-dependent 7-cyano-7-deazaguanine reductase QueF-like protein
MFREIKEALGLQKKKGNHLGQTFYRRDLWIPSENSTLMLLGIPTGVIDMVDGKLTKVSHHLDSKSFKL